MAGIFAAKGRPRFNPLIVHVRDAREAERHALFSDTARRLAARFWPGALTLVCRAPPRHLSELVSAGLPGGFARARPSGGAGACCRKRGLPIAAPSANPSGKVSATLAAHVAEALQDKVDFILDGGPAMLGLESTVIGFDGDVPVLLRPGAIAREEIEARHRPVGESRTGHPIARAAGKPLCALRRGLRLNASKAEQDEALLGFGPDVHARSSISAPRAI